MTAFLLCCLTTTSATAQTTRYVSTTGNDAGECATAPSPCASVSYAYQQSDPGDTIEIGIGEFTEANGIEIDQTITLQGTGHRLGGTILQAHALPGEATSRVIDIPFVSGGADVVISDLTIRHGVAEGVSSTQTVGGGLNKTTNSVNLVLENVRFFSNKAESNGGGARIHVPFSMVNVEFVDNESGQNGGGLWAHDNSSSANTQQPEMNQVLFSANIATGCGGGLAAFSIDADISEAAFTNNTAGDEGGGLCIDSQPGTTTLTDARFQGNQADQGGGLFLAVGSLTLINSSLLSNHAENGGGLYVGSAGESPSAGLVNVTLTYNSADQSGGGLHHFVGESSLRNVIAWGNSAVLDGNDIFSDNDLVELRYSLHGGQPNDVVVEDDLVVENTLTGDPRFVDSASGDLRLSHDSPAIDAGDPATDPAQFPGGPANPTDPDGNPRFFGDAPDIGAFESQWLPDLLFQDRFQPD